VFPFFAGANQKNQIQVKENRGPHNNNNFVDREKEADRLSNNKQTRKKERKKHLKMK
jgi:hypothetical protein